MPARAVLVAVLALHLAACGGPDAASTGSPPVPPPPAPLDTRVVLYEGPALVSNASTTVTGRVSIYRPSAGAAAILSVGAPMVDGHEVAGGSLQFIDASAPEVRTYGTGDVSPNSTLYATDGGDPYQWATPTRGALVLAVTDATPGAMHGTLHVSMRFASMGVNF